MNVEQQPVQVFVECAADIPGKEPPFNFTRKHYMYPDQSHLFRQHWNNTGVYETVMRYINPVWFQNEKGRWILNARDSLKYGDLYLDFDYPLETDDDFGKIKADIHSTLRYLKVILSIDSDQVRFYFSGSKGIHAMVPAETLCLDPHYSLNEIYKEIAKDIEKYLLFKTLDTGIYDDKRMFRMPNSFNLKGERFKVPITLKELNTLSLEEIRELAKQPRELEFARPIPSQKAKLALNKQIQMWSQRFERQREFSGKILKLEKVPACIEAMMTNTFRQTVNERNNSGTALASFFMQQGMDREEAIARLVQWGEENCIPPLPRNETEVIVNSVYNGQHRYGCASFQRLSGVCNKQECPLFSRG